MLLANDSPAAFAGRLGGGTGGSRRWFFLSSENKETT